MLAEEKLPDPWKRRLYLPAYQVSTAARYARVAPQTVTYWHYATAKVGPALPGKDRGARLSYLQLIEVAFVATFRRLGLSLQRIRNAREYAAQTLEAEFPFAQYRWKTEGMNLLLDLKQVDPSSSLDALIIANAAGQTAWTDLVSDRFLEFDYEGGMALKWHVAGRESPVLIDPRVSFGAPMVKGVATWALKGRHVAGEDINNIAEDFSLREEDVIAALAFEGLKPAA
jgi:uncharacterized protein (DUF433 family)